LTASLVIFYTLFLFSLNKDKGVKKMNFIDKLIILGVGYLMAFNPILATIIFIIILGVSK
jgi:hypothetical protein